MNALIEFECAACGQALSSETAGAGLMVECPLCKRTVKVPRPAGGATPIQPPPPTEPAEIRVTITDIDIPFGRQVSILFSVFVAAIPAAFLSALLVFLFLVILNAITGR